MNPENMANNNQRQHQSKDGRGALTQWNPLQVIVLTDEFTYGEKCIRTRGAGHACQQLNLLSKLPRLAYRTLCPFGTLEKTDVDKCRLIHSCHAGSEGVRKWPERRCSANSNEKTLYTHISNRSPPVHHSQPRNRDGICATLANHVRWLQGDVAAHLQRG